MWMQMAPPQNELVTRIPSDDVRGISRRRALRSATTPIYRACSPRPYCTRASGGTDPRTFCDPVKIISPPIRMCRTRPAILPQFLRSFIVLLLSTERAAAGPGRRHLASSFTTRGLIHPARHPHGRNAKYPPERIPAPRPARLPSVVGIHGSMDPPRGTGAGTPDYPENHRQPEGRSTQEHCHTVPARQPKPRSNGPEERAGP